MTNNQITSTQSVQTAVAIQPKQQQNPKKTVKPWTSFDEDRLIANVEKHVLCLRKAFEQTALEVQRSPKAVAAHWYSRTSKKSGRTLFMTVSGKHVAVNRKNSKGQPLKLSMYKRLLAFLGFNY